MAKAKSALFGFALLLLTAANTASACTCAAGANGAPPSCTQDSVGQTACPEGQHASCVCTATSNSCGCA